MKPASLASLLLILFAACAFLPATAQPDPSATTASDAPLTIPHATLIYYDISGSTADQLRAELDRLGPVGYDQVKSDATTRWYIHWNWSGYGNAQCDLNSAQVTYDIQVTFPRWNPPADAAPGLVERWQAYVHALAIHEQGHVDYIVAHYATVRAAILGATCQTAEAAAQAALQPLHQHDIDYDAQTGHGATQGASFP